MGESVSLTKVGTGSYRSVVHEVESSTHGPLRFTRTMTLVVAGGRATWAQTETGTYAGHPPNGSYTSRPPQGFTLKGRATFS